MTNWQGYLSIQWRDFIWSWQDSLRITLTKFSLNYFEKACKLLLELFRSYYSSLNRKERRDDNIHQNRKTISKTSTYSLIKAIILIFCLLLVAIIKDNTSYARMHKKFTQTNNKLQTREYVGSFDVIKYSG